MNNNIISLHDSTTKHTLNSQEIELDNQVNNKEKTDLIFLNLIKTDISNSKKRKTFEEKTRNNSKNTKNNSKLNNQTKNVKQLNKKRNESNEWGTRQAWSESSFKLILKLLAKSAIKTEKIFNRKSDMIKQIFDKFQQSNVNCTPTALTRALSIETEDKVLSKGNYDQALIGIQKEALQWMKEEQHIDIQLNEKIDNRISEIFTNKIYE